MRLRIVLALVVGLFIVAPNAEAATSTVRYGPFTVPAASGETPGMLTAVKLGVSRPCVSCYITSFHPNLVYSDGSTADRSTDMMLHHALWTSQFRTDATCGNEPLGLAGQRFFASGDERTPIDLPAGYGYRVRWYDVWHMLVDLMNMAPEPQTVYVAVTYTYRWPWENVLGVTPVWLDIDQCGDSEYAIEAGYSDKHGEWSVNAAGDIVAAIGHVHGHGIAVEATNESVGGASICRSDATLDPDDPHHVMSMTSCTGNPLAHVAQGQTVRLHSMYDSPHPANDVMGIMLMYVRPT